MYHCKLQNIPAVWLTVNRRICGSDGHVCPIASIISSQSMKAGSVTIICLCKPRCWQVCIITLIQICFPSSGRGPGSQLSVVAVWRVASTTHTFSRPRQWDVFASQFYICARLQFHHLRLGKGGIDWDWTLATWQDLLGLPANLFAIPTVQSYKIETNYFANFVKDKYSGPGKMCSNNWIVERQREPLEDLSGRYAHKSLSCPNITLLWTRHSPPTVSSDQNL